MRVRALRGAITSDGNTKDGIMEATAQLLGEMLDRNEVEEDDIIYIAFTATKDLTAEFPAIATRKLGLDKVPVICLRELDIESSLPGTIRILMLIYTEREREQLKHVYMKGASQLRKDLSQ